MIIHHSSVVELTNITIDSNKVPISGYFVHHWNLPASWSLWSPNLYNDPSNYTLYHHLSKLAWIRTWLNRFCGDGLQLTQLKHIDQLLINNRSINSQVVGGGFNIPTSKMLWPTAQDLFQESERDNMAPFPTIALSCYSKKHHLKRWDWANLWSPECSRVSLFHF